MEGVLVLWAILAFPFMLWGKQIAEYRGRSPIWGLVLGLLFGIFGVAMAWLLPPNEGVIWARRAQWEAEFYARHPSASIGSPARGSVSEGALLSP